MAGKKKEEVDAAKDFFGGEEDWFVDEDAAQQASSAAAPPAPAAAAAPAPVQTPPSSPPAPPPAPAPVPSAETSAPTLMFSLDQLPEIPLPDEKPAETLTSFPATESLEPRPAPEMPEVPAPESRVEWPLADAVVPPPSEAPTSPGSQPDLPDLTQDTELAVAPISALAAAPSASVTLTPFEDRSRSDAATLESTEEMQGEMVEAPSEVLVRETGSPSPARVEAPSGPTEIASEELPQPPLARFTPGTERDDWRSAVGFLEGEGSRDPGRRGMWLALAGQLAINRAGDPSTAERLLSAAADQGAADATSYRVLEEVTASSGRWEAALSHVEARAVLTPGAAAADAWYEAALLARHQLGRTADALVHLEVAAAADPDHFAACSLQRDLLVETGDRSEALTEVLGRMARLSDGWLASEALADQAELYASMGRVADARASWERAAASSPGWGLAFNGLEAALLASGDHAGLAELYRSESGVGGPDEAWWRVLEARQLAELGRVDDARAAWQAAFVAGDSSAVLELEAAERARGDVAGIASALALLAGPGDLWAKWRLAVAQEAAGSNRDALENYQAIQAADPTAWPAADAAARLLKTVGDAEQVRSAWGARLAASSGDEARAVAVVVGELAAAAGDVVAAAAAWEPLVVGSDFPARLAALALTQLYRTTGNSAGLAAVSRTRASWESEPRRANDLRWTAATGAVPVDLALAVEILATDPGHPGALERVVAEGGLAAGAAWEAAMSGADPAQVPALAYLAARAWQAVGDVGSARRAAENLAIAHPLVDLLAADLDVGRMERWRARAETASDPAERVWGWFACGAAEDLAQLVAQDPGHSGALAAIEVLRLGDADPTARIEFYAAAVAGPPNPARRAAALRLASELAVAGRRGEAISALSSLETVDLPELPLRAASRMAESLGDFALGARLLSRVDAPQAQLERGRLLDAAGDANASLAVYRKVLAEASERRVALDAGLGVARTALAVGDRAGWIAGHGAVATSSSAAAQQAAYAGWVAAWLEEDALLDQALPFAHQAVAGRPGSLDNFETLLRILQQRGDSAAIRALLEATFPGDALRLADALEAAGDLAGQIEVLEAAASASAAEVGLLPVLVRLEVLLARNGAWQGVYDLLTRRRDLTTDEGTRLAIDARRRWLLAEKLSDTEQAWDLYRQLHLDAPADREVTTALARIAAARGEHALAVQFLRELAETAVEPEDAARCQRLVASTSEAMGNPAGARQAYLDALDHVPDDLESMAGLKRLARASDDWPALIAVLQREAGLADSVRKVEIRREVAQVTEIQGGDPGIAIEAWRGVLELAPRDPEALDRVYLLAQQGGQWATMVEVGSTRVDLAAPEEQGALLDLLGDIASQHLDPGEGVRFYERAVGGGYPSVAAARKLEARYRGRSEWKQAAGVLEVLAKHEPETSDRTAALLRLAKMEIDLRRDREAAAGFYQRAFALDPSNDVASRFLATWLVDSGKSVAALPVFVALEPRVEDNQDLDDPDVRLEVATYWFQFGELLRTGGRAEESVARYERALELNPAHQLALEAVGSVWVSMNDWKKAGKAFSQLLQVTGGQGERGKVANAYTQLGLVERALGSGEKAEKRFAKALEVLPNHVGALKGTGRLAEDRQDWNGLMTIFNAVIVHATVPADVVEAYMTKGRVLDEHLGRADKAAQHYQRSLDFDPNQPVALLRLAEISTRTGDWAQVAALTDRGLKLQPGADLARCRPALLLLFAVAEAKQGTAPSGRAEEAAAADPRFAVPVADLDAVRAAVRLAW